MASWWRKINGNTKGLWSNRSSERPHGWIVWSKRWLHFGQHRRSLDGRPLGPLLRRRLLLAGLRSAEVLWLDLRGRVLHSLEASFRTRPGSPLSACYGSTFSLTLGLGPACRRSSRIARKRSGRMAACCSLTRIRSWRRYSSGFGACRRRTASSSSVRLLA